MKIIRLIFSVLFILASVLAGVLTYLAYTHPELKNTVLNSKDLLERYLPVLADQVAPLLPAKLALGEVLVGLTVVFLAIATLLWPPSGPKKPAKKRAPTSSSVLDAVPASGSAAKDLPPMQAAELEQEMDASDDPEDGPEPQAAGTLDEAVMRDLINKEQLSINRAIATEIINKSYPRLVPVIGNFHDEESLVTLARQIIAILRIRVKLKDKTMSSYQFSQFEDKAYKMEEEKVFHRYSPKDPVALKPEQRALVGHVFALNSYRAVQQQLLASRDDWEFLSVKDLG